MVLLKLWSCFCIILPVSKTRRVPSLQDQINEPNKYLRKAFGTPRNRKLSRMYTPQLGVDLKQRYSDPFDIICKSQFAYKREMVTAPFLHRNIKTSWIHGQSNMESRDQCKEKKLSSRVCQLKKVMFTNNFAENDYKIMDEQYELILVYSWNFFS